MNAVTRVDRSQAERATEDVVRALGGALLTIKDIVAWTGKNRSTIYRWIGAGRFPEGKPAGANSRLWTRQEVQDWMDHR